MNSFLIKSRTTTTIKCSSDKTKTETPVTVARKAFEKKRSVSLKENANKLLAIATADWTEIKTFAQELDQIHKKEINEFVQQIKTHITKDNTTQDDVTSDKNIFLTKDLDI